MTKKTYNTPVILWTACLTEKSFVASTRAEGEDMTEVSDQYSDFLSW
ncbi:MAG: hypothetical protein IKR69_04620 [Bacteroidales bacterium]|nr:hypothetical protein [Bacteroidales bacterium]